MPPAQTNNHHNEESNEIKEDIPPHGGSIVRDGKYNFEILLNPFNTEEKLFVWILNQRNKLLVPKNAIATMTLNYKNASVKKEMIFKEGAFCSGVEDVKNAFNAVITVSFKNKIYTATYFHKGLNN